MLHFLDPVEFKEASKFLDRVAPLDPEFSSHGGIVNKDAVERAKNFLSSVLELRMLRRRKATVLPALPPKHVLILPVPMMNTQHKCVSRRGLILVVVLVVVCLCGCVCVLLRSCAFLRDLYLEHGGVGQASRWCAC